jgi:hypothetical protein
VLSKEKIDQAVGHEKRSVRSQRIHRVSGGIGDDHPLRAHLSRHRDGNVGREPAVDKQSSVPPFGGEEQRDTGARSHRLGKVSGREHHNFSMGQIGGDCAKGNGQGVEISPGQQITAEHRRVHHGVDLGLDQRGALQGETPLALLPHHQRLQRSQRTRGERLIAPEESG